MLEALFPLFGLLLLVWVVVEAVFRFIQKDTLEYDLKYLWNGYGTTRQDIVPPKHNRKKVH